MQAEAHAGEHVSHAFGHPSGPVVSFVSEESTFDPGSLEQALVGAVALPGLGRLSVEARREQRAEISAFHACLYDSLLSGGGG